MATIIVDKLMAIAERSPALRGRRLTRPSNFLYVILYIRRRAYSGLCGSCVRMFAITYVE